jgi:hypothetical protein
LSFILAQNGHIICLRVWTIPEHTHWTGFWFQIGTFLFQTGIGYIRADLAMTGTLVENYPLYLLVSTIEVPNLPNPEDLVPAMAGTLNELFTPEEKQMYQNATVIHGNGICATSDNIVSALHQSLVSAFIYLASRPDHSSCIAPDKWDMMATFIVLFLGYRINSQTMMITWPLYKQQALYEDIQTALHAPVQNPPKVVAASTHHGNGESSGKHRILGPLYFFQPCQYHKKLPVNVHLALLFGPFGLKVKFDSTKV